MLIIHGSNNVFSRKFLTDKTRSFLGEIVNLDGEKLNLTQLRQTLESISLFNQDRLIVIENIFTRRSSKERTEILGHLKLSNPANVILWEEKPIDGRTLAPFSGAKIQRFDLSRTIFKFLDSVFSGNRKISLSLLKQCLTQDTPEMIFYMFSLRVRSLIIALDLGEKGLTDMPRWQQNKLIFQAKKFGLEKLLIVYKQLLKIDIQQKTGKNIIPLSSQLDLLIAYL